MYFLKAIQQEYSNTHDVTIGAISMDLQVRNAFYANHGASLKAAINKLLQPSRRNPWSAGPLPNAAPAFHVIQERVIQETVREERVEDLGPRHWIRIIFAIVVGIAAYDTIFNDGKLRLLLKHNNDFSNDL